MKLGSKEGWKSILPLKSSTSFCVFPRAKAVKFGTPVYLNVYDLTPMNGYVYWAGFGIFHSGVEVHGAEYAFGAHDYPTSGVFEVEPRQCPGFKFRKSILIGTTCLDPLQVREFMEQHSANYNGDTYHLIAKNCNHFCRDVCYKLTGKQIPKWVNRLAKIVEGGTGRSGGTKDSSPLFRLLLRDMIIFVLRWANTTVRRLGESTGFTRALVGLQLHLARIPEDIIGNGRLREDKTEKRLQLPFFNLNAAQVVYDHAVTFKRLFSTMGTQKV